MNIIHNSIERRKLKVRKKLSSNQSLPRLSVFRSNRHIWAQIIDDKKAKTLASTSSKILKTAVSKTQQSQKVGQQIAKLAQKVNITRVRFDRGPYRYHGRVKALAEAARSAGLKF